MNVLSLILFFSFFAVSTANAQIVNGYAKVESITNNILTLSNVDQTADDFGEGEQIIIMQMQDNVIGNTDNTPDFGNIGSISSAGLYEVAQIESVTTIGGVLETITVSALSNTYNVCDNCSLQVISFPTLGSPDYSTASDILAKLWDGNTGGVVAFRDNGNLTLNHHISTDGAGFKGGLFEEDPNSGSCDPVTYYSSTSDFFAKKGEGIFKNTNPDYAEARGKILNGGGGGNSHNAGGGGGGNFTAGGEGGAGWNCSESPAGGLGGIPLDTEIKGNRIFMGGGGGAGEGNDLAASSGGNGGGIILLRANKITTTGNCSNFISANGQNADDSGGNDGAGGGGAGGSVVLKVDQFDISSTCTLNITANGGNGSSVSSVDTHGGGGGGGQGLVIYSAAQPVNNVTTSTTNGAGGCDNQDCTSQAANGSGINNSGIKENTATPLPVRLVSFSVKAKLKCMEVNWKTASETDNAYFTVEKSKDMLRWEPVHILKGAGNKHTVTNYQVEDHFPFSGISYYRIKQTDFDGRFSYSGVINAEFHQQNLYKIYPNPSKGKIHIDFPGSQKKALVEIQDMSGRKVISSLVVQTNKQTNKQLIFQPFKPEYIPS